MLLFRGQDVNGSGEEEGNSRQLIGYLDLFGFVVWWRLSVGIVDFDNATPEWGQGIGEMCGERRLYHGLRLHT
jgi:hypothetical protein